MLNDKHVRHFPMSYLIQQNLKLILIVTFHRCSIIKALRSVDATPCNCFSWMCRRFTIDLCVSWCNCPIWWNTVQIFSAPKQKYRRYFVLMLHYYWVSIDFPYFYCLLFRIKCLIYWSIAVDSLLRLVCFKVFGFQTRYFESLLCVLMQLRAVYELRCIATWWKAKFSAPARFEMSSIHTEARAINKANANWLKVK